MKRFRNLLPNLMVIAASVNFILFCVKLYVGMVSSSISIYSDAVNNLFDVFSVMLAFFGVRFMVKKAPPEYPDGYSKTEHIVGLLMSVAVGITGAYFAYSSLERLIYPRPVNYMLRYAVILAVTAAVKLLLGFVLRKADKTADSVILKTVYLDSFSDCGVTVMILISFILTNYAGIRIDAVFGLAVSGIIIANAVKLVKQSLIQLLGKNDEKMSAALIEEFSVYGIRCMPVRASKSNAQVVLSEYNPETVKDVSQKLSIDIYIGTEEI